MGEIDLDVGMLEGLRELLGDKFVELINTFNADCGARLQRMKGGLEAMDFELIRNEAHGVKGSSRNIGANSLASLAGSMEEKARAADNVDMEQLFSAIEQQFAAVSEKLKGLL